MVAEIIDEAVAAKGWGAQSGLARAAGVEPPSVARWRTGVNPPEPTRWPAIEEYLGLEPGTIAAAAAREHEALLLGVRQDLLDLLDDLRTSGNTESAEKAKSIYQRLDSLKPLLE